MKIGIIADLHNNIEALKAVLNEFDKRGVEKIICAGDIIGIGPFPDEVVKKLSELENVLSCIKGNHESYFIDGMENSKMDEHERQYHEWEHSRLSKKSIEFLHSLSESQIVNIKGKVIHVLHYASSNGGYLPFVRNPQVKDLDVLYKNVDGDIIVYGHDHKPSYIIGEKIYVNPGSLGCPSKDKNKARAGILEIEEKVTYEQLYIEYDVQKVLNSIENFNYPAKEIIKKIFYGTE